MAVQILEAKLDIVKKNNNNKIIEKNDCINAFL